MTTTDHASSSGDRAFAFLVTVTTDTADHAADAMAHRLGHEAEYGYNYELGWQPARLPELVGRGPHRRLTGEEIDRAYVACNVRLPADMTTADVVVYVLGIGNGGFYDELGDEQAELLRAIAATDQELDDLAADVRALAELVRQSADAAQSAWLAGALR